MSLAMTFGNMFLRNHLFPVLFNYLHNAGPFSQLDHSTEHAAYYQFNYGRLIYVFNIKIYFKNVAHSVKFNNLSFVFAFPQCNKYSCLFNMLKIRKC